MSNMGDHFRRGKLQVASSVIGNMIPIYEGTKAGKALTEAFYAVNRADHAIVEYSDSQKVKAVKKCRKKKSRRKAKHYTSSEMR